MNKQILNVALALALSGSALSAHAASYTFTDLGTLGGTISSAHAINDAGQVAGFAYTANDDASHATVWNGTTPIDLGTLGGTSSRAYAINNAGQVAGYAYTANNAAYHATVWNGTTPTDLGTLGGTYSVATAINDAGQVAGSSLTANADFHAILWNGTTPTDLGTLGGTYSRAYAINNAGQVAGWSHTASNVAHATLWNGTDIIDLNSLLNAETVNAGWVLNYANDINDNGWIVGEASNASLGIQSRAFLLSPAPVPVPAAAWLLGSGLLGLIGVGRRRRSFGHRVIRSFLGRGKKPRRFTALGFAPAAHV